MAESVFWMALTVVVYVYIGYPLLLLVWRGVASRPVQKRPFNPTVSLLVVMHNESANVSAKMQNCLSLDYPPGKLQTVVSLDAPTDNTEALVREYSPSGVVVVGSHVRQGKAAAINRGAAVARGRILVFTDARQRFERRAIRELVANFADPSVGAVSGELILLDEDGREAANAVGLYWRYEKGIRSMESEIHSLPGATGAIYAIRRELFEPLPQSTVLDDVMIPMRIVLRGKRAIFDPAARAYDRVVDAPAVEYERKIRTLTGNYELLTQMPQLLLPWRNPIFLQLISHKAGRLVVPYCLGALLAANLFLLRGFYLLFFAGQIAFYALAAAGWVLAPRTVNRAAPSASTAFEHPERHL